MNEQPSFDSLFSSFIPLKSYNRNGGGKGKASIFKIEVLSGEPYLSLVDKKINPRDMSLPEKHLYDEIVRLSEEGSFFEAIRETDGALRVSIWEHPHLMNLLSGEITINGPKNTPLNFSEDLVYVLLSIETTDESEMAEMSLKLRMENEELDSFIFLNDRYVLHKNSVYSINSVGANFAKIASLISPVEKEHLAVFLTLFLSFVENITPEINGQAPKYSQRPEYAVPTIFLEKVAADKALYLRCGVSLESLPTELPGNFIPVKIGTIEGDGTLLIRNVEGLDVDECTDRLEKMILNAAPDRKTAKDVYRNEHFFIIPQETAGPFLLHSLPRILEEFHLVGSEKLREYKVVATRPKLNLRLSSGIDFLSGDGNVEIGEESFSISDILNQYANKRYIQLSDGNRGIIDENYINRLKRLFNRREKEGKIRINIFDLPEVESMLETKITGRFANKSRKVLEGFNALSEGNIPKYKVKAELRPYQNEGVKWLKYLYDNKLGGCLADDMGLGKTLQTISLLSIVCPKAENSSLIVMPRSLLFNWEKELKRFAPQIKFAIYYGPDRNLEEALKADVVLSTYAVVRNDVMTLKEHKFECIVLDESQNIKNVASQTASAIMLLDSEHRFALSGTPMENNLTELYSLFRFLNPTMFGRLEDFNSSYTYPIQKNGNREASDSLKRRIFPFILRRLKKEVLKDLPPRIDNTIYVEMSDNQRKLYEERRMTFKLEIEKAIKTQGVEKSQFILFQALSELRRIASVPESMSDGRVRSPKIDELLESVVASVENGHKSVIFFNFIAGLEIVGSRLEKAGISFESMTGSTSAHGRKKAVERFQTDPECKIMLMTLKVGGVGLNLTAADTVYVFEPWWNKAAEEQAINRLHRIGQKKTVNAFSIITVDTIEERILQLQEQKSDLFNELISSDSSSSKQLSEKDIEFILS